MSGEKGQFPPLGRIIDSALNLVRTPIKFINAGEVASNHVGTDEFAIGRLLRPPRGRGIPEIHIFWIENYRQYPKRAAQGADAPCNEKSAEVGSHDPAIH